jgi:hypothetical protein
VVSLVLRGLDAFRVLEERLQNDPETVKNELETPVVVAILELYANNQLQKITELNDGFSYVYHQIASERGVKVILPAEPSAEEVELLSNELKAFYYKNPDIDLRLDITVNKEIGVGRIYCFKSFLLDLTTKNVEKQMEETMMAKNLELSTALREYESLMKRPLNEDLPKKNTLYETKLRKYLHHFNVACGFAE